MSKRKAKVILIGSHGFQQITNELQVECYEWNKITRIKNLRDYDVIVLNIIGLSNDETRKAVAWEKFDQILNIGSTIDILSNGGMIFIVGDPRFIISSNKFKKNGHEDGEKLTEKQFLEWTGLKFDWDSEPGDSIIFQDDYSHRTYSEYIKNFTQWDYSLGNCVLNLEEIGKRLNLDFFKEKGFELYLDKDYFCQNRYKNALSFSLRIQYRQDSRHGKKVLNSFGPFIFLPKINLTEDDTIQLILSSILGVEVELPEPKWLIDYIAPGQERIDKKIALINTELESIFQKLSLAELERAEARKCLKLLYERDFALEPAVRDILRSLGAHIEDPKEKNKEDGWVVISSNKNLYEGVLEIKSTRSDQFSEHGRKQLLDWIDRGRTLREKNYKGIFIGNSGVDKPVTERAWAFSDSWTKAAELSGICAMKTEDLYTIYLLNSRGLINIEHFWDELFSTNGILEMKKYRELRSPNDED